MRPVETLPKIDAPKVQWGQKFDPFEKGVVTFKNRESLHSHAFELPNGAIVHVELTPYELISDEMPKDYVRLEKSGNQVVLLPPYEQTVLDFSILYEIDPALEPVPRKIRSKLYVGSMSFTSENSTAGSIRSVFAGTGMFDMWKLENSPDNKPFTLIIPNPNILTVPGRTKIQFEKPQEE